MAKKQNEVKICLWTHVQNEAHVIEKMLKTAAPYIDYWVLIDNGSTDGTQDIIKNFFEKEKIPGKLYQSEIGWKGHGINRQHSWDFLKKTDHGCDWILRIDADEGIEVSDNFDWKIIDTAKKAWSVIYHSGNHIIPRMWLWRANLPWFWAEDVAHETIHLPNNENPEEANLPMDFKHISVGGGRSYDNPIKYISDVLKLENQLHEKFRDGSTLQDERYHLYYLAISFNYSGVAVGQEWCEKLFPYGREHVKIFLERGIFYHTQLLENFEDRGEDFWTLRLRSELYERIGDEESARKDLWASYEQRTYRGESICTLFWKYYNENNLEMAFKCAKIIKDQKFPIEFDQWNLAYGSYCENNPELREAVKRCYEDVASQQKDENALVESVNLS